MDVCLDKTALPAKGSVDETVHTVYQEHLSLAFSQNAGAPPTKRTRMMAIICTIPAFFGGGLSMQLYELEHKQWVGGEVNDPRETESVCLQDWKSF